LVGLRADLFIPGINRWTVQEQREVPTA